MLEKALPPIEAPPAPVTSQDVARILPPPPAPPPPAQPPRPAPAPRPPVQQHAAPAAPPPTQPQRSPLSGPDRRQAPSSTASAAPAFVNPADAGARTRAKDAYLWQAIRKFSQYLPDLREKNEGGTVVLRFVIARDGRLVDASIVRSSGVIALDRGLLESVRAAAPYPPLPADIPGAQVEFVQPIQARR